MIDEKRLEELKVRIPSENFNLHDVKALADTLTLTLQVVRAAQAFSHWGRPGGNLPAFHDLHEDAIIYNQSWEMLTVGEIRKLQEALKPFSENTKEK